eukprot:1817788-Rhodomonas_salina.2
MNGTVAAINSTAVQHKWHIFQHKWNFCRDKWEPGEDLDANTCERSASISCGGRKTRVSTEHHIANAQHEQESASFFSFASLA